MRHVALYVGIEKDGAGKQIDPEVRANALQAVRQSAAQEFGGYTISNAAGGWLNPEGKLIEEGSIRLDLYTTKGEVQVSRWAAQVGAMFGQQSVLLDDAGNVEFVESGHAETQH
jgi:hypothetical protein